MDILAELNAVVAEYRGEANLKMGDNFADLGFDSLDKVELAMALEEKFDVTFPDDFQVNTVEELVKKIEELKA